MLRKGESREFLARLFEIIRVRRHNRAVYVRVTAVVRKMLISVGSGRTDFNVISIFRGAPRDIVKYSIHIYGGSLIF